MISSSSSTQLDYLNICGDIMNLDLNNGVFDDYPLTHQMPYGNIGSMVGTLTHVKLVSKKNQNMQVIEYVNENNFHFILKRMVMKCDLSPDKILSDINMRTFINVGIKEFIITKIISTHPAGIQAFDFKATFIQQKKWLITEFLMEKGGISLNEYLENPSVNFDFIKYFTQLSSLMQHMEKEQIYHSDIKFDNCLVDSKGNFRIIDYDVAKAEGYYSTTTKVITNNILGFTNGYVPPEIYNQIEEAIKNKKQPSAQNVMPWRADIYSCGILGLCISGAIDELERDNIKSLDSYKNNIANHKFITNKCKLVKCNSESLSKKMQYVLEVCLSYDPKMRITFKQLHLIMMKIKDTNYDLKKLQQEVEVYRNENKEYMTRNQLENNQQNLKSQLKYLMQRNQKIEEEFNQLNGKYKQTFDILEEHKHKLIYLNEKNEKLEESNRTKQKIINKNDYDKSELIANLISVIQPFELNFDNEITEFSQIIPIFQTLLKENKSVNEENLILKNENIGIQIQNSISNISQISPKNLRKVIQEKISNEKYWDFLNMDLSTN